MSSQANGQPALAVEEPGKVSAISIRQLSEWYCKRQVSMDSKILASGLSHCKLLASVFPASVDVKKIKTGYFSVVSSHNWKLFTTGMDRIGIKKIFDVAKLQLPNSVEMKQFNVWMKEFVEMNEKKFVGVPMEERPGAFKSVAASQVSIGSTNSVTKHNLTLNTIDSIEKKINTESSPRDPSLGLSSSASSGIDALDLSLPIPSPEIKGEDVFNVQDEDSPWNTTFITAPSRRAVQTDSVRRVLLFDD